MFQGKEKLSDRKRILVAEDEKPMAHALQLKLQALGAEVVVVYNGADAIKQLAQNDFDVALLDLVMPQKDGFAVLEFIKTLKNPPMAFVSSNLGQEEDISRAMSLGAKDFFVKSETPIAEVVAMIEKML